MDSSIKDRMDAVRDRLRREDPDVLAAVADVSPALLQWCAEQTPRERLIACTNTLRGLNGLRRGTSAGS